jgi:hypothetical protein
MSTNAMVITNAGLAEAANASAGGFLISVNSFRVGTDTTPAAVTDTDLKAPIITLNTIRNVQVVSNGAVRFTLFLAGDLNTTVWNIYEVGLLTASGVLFARGVFTLPVVKPVGVAIQIIAVVMATHCDLSTIDINVGMDNSIPSVAHVYDLPTPDISMHNLISVMDQNLNSMGDLSGGLAVKYGGSSTNRWGFSGYDLIYEGGVDAAGFSVSNPTSFFIAALTSRLSFADGERLLVQIVSGSGSGQVRRVAYRKASNRFEECENHNFNTLVASGANASRIVVWKASGSNASSLGPQLPPLPDNSDDYVLTVYNKTLGPKWLPVSASNNGGGGTVNGVNLYYPPSRIIFKSYMWTSDGKETSYMVPANFSTGATSAKPPEDICYTFVTVQGILQTRQSYELLRREYSVPPTGTLMYESIVQFSESPPKGSDIELWFAYRETGGSYYTKVQTFSLGSTLIPDGARKFFLTIDGSVTSAGAAKDVPLTNDGLFVSIGGIKQFNSSFTYNSNGSPCPFIEFLEAPPPGVPIEVSTLFSKASNPGVNESTVIINNDFYSYDTEITDVELSESLTSLRAGELVNNYVFVNVSGIYLHRDRYNVIGNRILFSSPIARKRPISVTLIKNVVSEGSNTSNLLGVVTDGMMSSDYLYLLRHNTLPVKIPVPRLTLKSGKGINISGSFPNLTVSVVTPSTTTKTRSPSRHTNLYTQEDVEEIIYTYRLPYTVSIVASLTADFSARLGPGFMTTSGREYIEYSVGVRTGAAREPAYGRRIKGTGEAGFCYLGHNAEYAYANASISDSYEFNVDNQGGYVDVVARMRVVNAVVSEVHSYLSVNFNLVIFSVQA